MIVLTFLAAHWDVISSVLVWPAIGAAMTVIPRPSDKAWIGWRILYALGNRLAFNYGQASNQAPMPAPVVTAADLLARQSKEA